LDINVRTLVDLVEVDSKIIKAMDIKKADLTSKPELIRLLSQRLYLLEKLEKD